MFWCHLPPADAYKVKVKFVAALQANTGKLSWLRILKMVTFTCVSSQRSRFLYPGRAINFSATLIIFFWKFDILIGIYIIWEILSYSLVIDERIPATFKYQKNAFLSL